MSPEPPTIYCDDCRQFFRVTWPEGEPDIQIECGCRAFSPEEFQEWLPEDAGSVPTLDPR